MKLYEISTELALINNQIDDAQGELSDELEKRLDESTLQLKDKVTGIAQWVVNLDSDFDAIQLEIDRLRQRQSIRKNLKDRLKEYVRICMMQADVKKIESSVLTVAVQKNPASAIITDEKLIPATYTTTEVVTHINKSRILADLKAGVEIPGAILEDDKTHLRIR